MAEDSRAVRILSDLCGVLRREKNIHDFGFVYCPEPLCNKSPIVVVDGNLGIETWSIKPLYFHAYSQLFHSKHRQHDLKRSGDCSMAVLLLNPDCLSAWNLRKQLVLNKYLTAEEELNLARLVLSKHPKSTETFSQRRWLLQQLFPIAKLEKGSAPRTEFPEDDLAGLHPSEADSLQEQDGENAHRQPHDETLMIFVRAEMEVCELAAGRYPSNYNAWSHRIWVVEHLAGCPPQFLKSELRATKSWVSSHVSDHSGFHYRQFLLGTLTGLSRPNRLYPGSPLRAGLGSDTALPGSLILEELQLILELVMSYPGHEAVWYHRRFVVYLRKTLLCSGSVAAVDQTTGSLGAYGGVELLHMETSSLDKASVKDCPTADQSQQKQQIGNCPTGKQPIENQPIKNRPLARRPFKNGQSEACGGDSQTDTGEDFRRRDAMFPAMQLPSRCSHDRSLLQPASEQVSDQLPPVQTSVQVTSKRPEGVSSLAHDVLPSEVLWLVQHERRFADIAVDGTARSERPAQQRCAENYCRWLENLLTTSGQ